jgi:hypothetical protein
MLKHLRMRKTDEGQGLVMVIAVVAIAAIVIGALEVSVIGDAKLAATSTSQEQALQAAETGLADYETNVNGSASQWQYAMSFCSSGTFNCVINGNSNVAPDPQNAAYSGIPDPNCTTSSYNVTHGQPGDDNYYGWVTVHGSSNGGYAEQFQYIVDSSLAKALGGYAHVFVTGRAGRSGHYVCSTIKALYNGPQLTSVNTVQLSPASCSGSSIPVAAPVAGTTIARVLIEATGGTGQTGGSSGLSAGGGVGGNGETVEATYAASNNSTIYVNIGCQGGSNTSIIQGGAGFASGGSLTGQGNAGGGGGATAVCALTPCTSATIGSGNLANNLYLLAGGGGGGGEGIFGATAPGGKGGSGVTASVASGIGENGNAGSNATAWFNINGGTGGAGGSAASGYVPGGGAGTHANGWFNADGGGGGAGYNGGSGGSVGFGGGGGGAGASFYNTNTSPSGGGIGAFVPGASGTGFVGSGVAMNTTPSNYGSVIIQWEDSTGAPVGTPVVPATCGPYSERTTQIPALSDVSLQVSGGSGGNGDNLSLFGNWFGSGAGREGVGATVVATYQNISTLPVDVTAIQGCQGAIGGDAGVTPGGDGLRTSGGSSSGGANCSGCSGNQGDAGSAGGASAICVGTIAPGADTPTSNNCTAGSSAMLMVAGGGAGGGGVSTSLLSLCSAGNGGAGGTALASDWPTSTNLTTGGVDGSSGTGNSGGWCSATAGGAGGSGVVANYAPTGSNGNSTNAICSGDGGAGGGGFDGGAAGTAGSGFAFFGFCILGGPGAGGGGGSSYLAQSTGSMVLQQCPSGSQCLYSACPTAGQSNPSTNQINTSNVAVFEGEWCSGQLDTNGAASITDTAIPNSSGVLSQSPTLVPTTPASLVW